MVADLRPADLMSRPMLTWEGDGAASSSRRTISTRILGRALYILNVRRPDDVANERHVIYLLDPSMQYFIPRTDVWRAAARLHLCGNIAVYRQTQLPRGGVNYRHPAFRKLRNAPYSPGIIALQITFDIPPVGIRAPPLNVRRERPLPHGVGAFLNLTLKGPQG